MDRLGREQGVEWTRHPERVGFSGSAGRAPSSGRTGLGGSTEATYLVLDVGMDSL